jgi:hypothetical protein
LQVAEDPAEYALDPNTTTCVRTPLWISNSVLKP